MGELMADSTAKLTSAVRYTQMFLFLFRCCYLFLVIKRNLFPTFTRKTKTNNNSLAHVVLCFTSAYMYMYLL